MGVRRSSFLTWSIILIASGTLIFGSLADRFQYEDLLIFVLLIYLGVGGLITIRRPENAIGWLFLGGVLIQGLNSLLGWYANYGLEVHLGSLPGADLVAAFTNGMGNIGFGVPLLFTFLLFPSGRLPSHRWRPVVWLGVLALVLSFLEAFHPGPLFFYPRWNNPLGIDELAGFFEFSTTFYEILATILFLAGPIALFLRYRRTSAVERQQIKLVAYVAGLVMMIVGVMLVASPLVHIDEMWLNLIFLLLLLSIPLSIGAAILRYRLWDIDIIIRRTLVYGALTLTLALIYFGSIVVLQGIFVTFSGQRSTAAVVISTLVIAALFTPLRRRIQNDIDRRFFRRKYDAQKTLEAFSASLRAELDFEELTDRLLAVVEDTLEPAHASLWIREKKR